MELHCLKICILVHVVQLLQVYYSLIITVSEETLQFL